MEREKIVFPLTHIFHLSRAKSYVNCDNFYSLFRFYSFALTSTPLIWFIALWIFFLLFRFLSHFSVPLLVHTDVLLTLVVFSCFRPAFPFISLVYHWHIETQIAGFQTRKSVSFGNHVKSILRHHFKNWTKLFALVLFCTCKIIISHM